jgi:large subunit ribosomal protein L22
MGKPKTEPKFKDNQAGATAKFVRVPPRKARLVMDAVRGKYVGDALALLKFVPNFAARAIEKVIESAVANAENSRPVSEATGKPLPPLVRENLRLVRGFIDEGPRIKRLQPRAQGRAYRILKRMCHISVIVEEVGPKPRPVRRPAVRRAQAAGRPAVAAPAAPAAAPAPAVETTAPEAVVEPVVEPTPAPEEKAE